MSIEDREYFQQDRARREQLLAGQVSPKGQPKAEPRRVAIDRSRTHYGMPSTGPAFDWKLWLIWCLVAVVLWLLVLLLRR